MYEFKNKRILILGLARSGIGAANLLSYMGCKIIISDHKDKEELRELLTIIPSDAELHLGGHPLSLLDDLDLIVLSPGIPLTIPFLKEAQNRNIKIVSEIEIAFKAIQYLKENLSFVDFIFLSVTGTNGKSTTTTLLYEFLKASNFNTIIAGNIGNSLSSEILNIFINNHNYYGTDNFLIVTELSSFQLETMYEFEPYGSTILNITPDHLDRYEDMDEYIKAKCRIFQRQSMEDFLILNADDPYTKNIIEMLPNQNRPHLFFFSRKKPVEGAFIENGVIKFNLPFEKLKTLKLMIDRQIHDLEITEKDFLIKGVHNIENIMASTLMAILSGCKRKAIEKVLKTFKGLEHRLEFVKEIDEVQYINDSKGTNIGAVMKSLESFSTPVILIAGGRDKGSDFRTLIPYIKNRVKAVILIGEASGKIAEALDCVSEIHFADTLKNAVHKAKALSSKGDTVLLSPGCASFDMFKDFEDRGRQFKELVNNL